MSAYLVRIAEDHEIVGLFTAPNLEMLCEAIDECCDPQECEYIRLPSIGGLRLSAAGAPAVPDLNDSETDPAPDWFAGADVSEAWEDIFYTEKKKWRPITRELFERWSRGFCGVDGDD